MKIPLKLNFNPLSKAVECFRKCLTHMEVKFSKSEVLEQVTHFLTSDLILVLHDLTWVEAARW